MEILLVNLTKGFSPRLDADIEIVHCFNSSFSYILPDMKLDDCLTTPVLLQRSVDFLFQHDVSCSPGL